MEEDNRKGTRGTETRKMETGEKGTRVLVVSGKVA